jgi:Na+/H+ antiporter NhaD/arsenite permease-like protein
MVFFVFVVANAGGCLTPLGDPPLFMGYLQGVPFFWTLGLWKIWLTAVGLMLLVYYVWERLAWHREREGEGKGAPEPRGLKDVEALSVEGLAVNGLLLAGVLVIVAVGHWLPSLPGGLGVRELAMAGLAAASVALTPRDVRRRNRFTTEPVIEVAILFAGIFLTMMPALALLEARGHELGIGTPGHFYWASGLLSSFLDNAPTYLVFFALAKSLAASGAVPAGNLVAGVPQALLLAVSAGAVLMGANTYIGNGPNFMIKSIAEERGVKMPSFAGYMGYAAVVLLPIFTIVWLVFFAGGAPA